MLSSEFISDCLAGKEEAIQTLVRTHQRNVFQLALSIIDTANAPISETVEQAEAATREIFVAALDRLSHYREDTSFDIWLYQVAYEVSLRHAKAWRRKLRWRALLTGKRSTQEQPGKVGDQVNQTASEGIHLTRGKGDEDLWRAVCALKDGLRIPVVLRYYHDLSIDQIAKILRLSDGAVHARLDMAREKLAERKANLPTGPSSTS
jgi:RNA polymerase sigma-70 factor, ECF subfamily